MRKAFKSLLPFPMFFLIAGFYYTTQITIDREHSVLVSDKKETEFILPPEYMRIAAMGYEQLLSDFLWLQATQYITNTKDAESPWLYHTLDTIAFLDPKFKDVFTIGGIWLSVILDMGEESNRLLKKGFSIFPDEWQIPFMIGFNHLYYYRNYHEAARYIGTASLFMDAPAFLRDLSIRLFAQAGNPQLAVDILSRMYQNAHDEIAKKSLEEKLKKAVVERDVQLLERAIGGYRMKMRRAPGSLRDLTSSKMIKNVPLEPFGGKYYIDEKGNAKTTSRIERLRIHEIQRPERMWKKYPELKKDD